MPKPERLSVLDGVLLIVGLIVGTGVLRVPASIAQQTTGPSQLMLVVCLGGIFAFCGAFCYAQLARLYPSHGGEYAYLHESLGAGVSFTFVWSRLAVLQTGSIAATCFIFGDYASKLLPLGRASNVVYALVAVVALSLVHSLGLRPGRIAQGVLSLGKIAGVVAIIAAGLLLTRHTAVAAAPAASDAHVPVFGLAMVLVMYAYGGWNEASYLAADMRRGQRDLALVLFLSVAAVAAIYLGVIYAYVRGLGFEGLQVSPVPAAEVVAHSFGRGAEQLIAVLAVLITLGTASATIFTGSRPLHALGMRHPGVRWLRHIHPRFGTPTSAFVLQGLMSGLLVVCFGASGDGGRHGFESAVEYTAPAFWAFMVLLGSVAVRHAWTGRGNVPGRVGLLVAGVLFVLVDAYMLYSSVAYVRTGALLSLGVVGLGWPLYAVIRRLDRRSPAVAPVAMTADQIDGS